VQVPVIVVNGIKTPEQAAGLVESGMADLVAVGRGMLVDPEWAAKAADGRPVIACRSCSPCRWFVDSARCPVLKKAKKTAGK
jgi:NADPH2 dehydrogenase